MNEKAVTDFNSEEIKGFVSEPFFDEKVIIGEDRSWPKISIITPSYNQAEFLEGTILSVLNQNYPNLEYIIIDGGSTDGSIEIIKKYEKYITYWVSESDKGQSDAINRGFKMARGEILAWLNSDDTYLPGALGKAVEFFSTHSYIGMVYGKTYFINERGDVIGNYPTESFNYNELARSNFFAQPAVFFRREVYFAVGGLDLNLHYTMDYDLWVRIAKKHRVEYLPVFLSTYRLHMESKTVSDDIRSLRASEECLRTVMKYYKWAPPNHVYGYCYHILKNKMPSFLVKSKPLILFLSTFIFLVKYIYLNKGIKLEDIKMINPGNIRKLCKGWGFRNLLIRSCAEKHRKI